MVKNRNAIRNILATVFCLLTTFFVLAQGPQWWFSRGAVDATLAPNDYQIINQGQLKWLATNAAAEMNAYFGAGPTITALISTFSNSNNYYLANIGQLKYVARPFYDRLYQLNLTNTFPANMPGYYPWGNVSQTNDFALANIGQAKYVFSFDSAVDSDSDGLPDWREAGLGTNPYDPDSDDDGFPDDWEVANGYDPLDGSDGALLREKARQRIVYHWKLFYGTPLVFPHTPGSQADLNDMRDALNALSGKFYKVE